MKPILTVFPVTEETVAIGLTLRDYIAIQLMPEILSRMGLGLSKDAVRYAYEIADIMIEARSQ